MMVCPVVVVVVVGVMSVDRPAARAATPSGWYGQAFTKLVAAEATVQFDNSFSSNMLPLWEEASSSSSSSQW
uniref:Putative secreted protein n=1 Tax=Anopheles darlingi TaxID=43151 RepID=A0A2M4DK18_ANODA